MVCGHTLVCEYALSSAVSPEGVLTVSLSLYYHEVTSYMLLLIAVPPMFLVHPLLADPILSEPDRPPSSCTPGRT